MYTARVVNTLSSARVRCTFRCDTANYLLEPFVRFPVIRSSRIPLIPMQSAVKCAALHGTVAAPGPSQPLRFCLSATHFRCKCSSIGNANTEMVAVATLPHPAATHLFTITLDNNQTRRIEMRKHRLRLRRDVSLPRLSRSRYIRHGITSFHCLVSVGPGTYVTVLRHFTASSRRSRYIRHDITSFHCLISVGPGTYVTVLRHFTASSRWSRYIRHDITSFYCLVSVGPGTYVTILRHFTASSRSVPVHTSRYYVISLPRLVGPGTYVTILRHFTASSRSVPVHTLRYYVISLPRLVGPGTYVTILRHCTASSRRSRYIRHGITSFHCLVSLVPVHTSRYYVILLPRLGRFRYIRHDITSFHCALFCVVRSRI